MTNGERIRKSTDSELYNILTSVGAENKIGDLVCKRCQHTQICDEEGTCVYRDDAIIRIWLEQEECDG